jgi:hypothetical protein
LLIKATPRSPAASLSLTAAGHPPTNLLPYPLTIYTYTPSHCCVHRCPVRRISSLILLLSTLTHALQAIEVLAAGTPTGLRTQEVAEPLSILQLPATPFVRNWDLQTSSGQNRPVEFAPSLVLLRFSGISGLAAAYVDTASPRILVSHRSPLLSHTHDATPSQIASA